MSGDILLGKSGYTDMDAEIEQHNDDVEQILARTQRSFSSRSRTRNIYEAPEFIKRLNAFEEVTAGDTVAFSCQWKALPKPTIKWYKDDEEITEDERYTFGVDEQQCTILTMVIKNAKKGDEGAYKCKAENQEGVASTTGYLSVSGGSDTEEKTLASKQKEQKSSPRKTPEHVSSAPFLRTIVEQYSVEEREAISLQDQPPSPIQDFIDQAQQVRARGVTWPLMDGYNDRDDDAQSTGSDTSVESQDFDRVSFSAEVAEDDVFTDQIPHDELSLLQGAAPSCSRADDAQVSNGSVQQSRGGAEFSTPDIRVTPADVKPRKTGHKTKHKEHRHVSATRPVLVPARLPSLDFLDLSEMLESEWAYFLPVVSCVTFCASATQINPLFLVILMVIISLVIFRFVFKQDNT